MQIQRFSSRKNVLHIILDGYQSDVFEEIVNDGEDGARFTSALEGGCPLTKRRNKNTRAGRDCLFWRPGDDSNVRPAA